MWVFLYGSFAFAMFVATIAVPKTTLRVVFGLTTVAMIVVPLGLLAYALSHMQMSF
jgi:hypothetical protein